MKRVIATSVFGAFDYVMEHYGPGGQSSRASRQDSYAIISLQDSQNGGFGVEFIENAYCKGVLTLIFDDIEGAYEGFVLFDEQQAREIVQFIEEMSKKVDTILVHCFAGQARAKAVASLVANMNGQNMFEFLEGRQNPFIINLLDKALEDHMLTLK